MASTSCKTRSYDFFVDKDLFGHSVTFNFDRKGDTHKTAIGGILSVIIKLFLTFYVVILLRKFFTRGDPANGVSI